MQNKFILLLICAVTLLALAGCGNADKNLIGSGQIQVPAYDIAAPSGGEILGLIAEKGERITKGQPLFAIADDAADKAAAQLTTNLAKAQAELKAMEEGISAPAGSSPAAVSAASAALSAAQQKADKMNRLLAMGAVSKRQADAANAELSRARADLAAAQSHSILQCPASPEAIASKKQVIEAIKKELAVAEARQRANEAASPCTGIITAKEANIGDTAAKGQRILTIRALDTCTVTIKVSAAQSQSLRPGQIVLLTTGGSAPFNGSIQSIAGATVTISSTEKPEDLQEGSSIDVSLTQG